MNAAMRRLRSSFTAPAGNRGKSGLFLLWPHAIDAEGEAAAEEASVGALSDFDLDRLITSYGCRSFVETGTGIGRGVEFASRSGFDRIVSIEIVHKLALDVAIRFAKNHKVTIINAKSVRGLREALDEMPPEVPILFWLDARFPGADYGLKSYDAERDETLRLPLESEIRTLAGLRDLRRDVFLINELRLYEDAAYEEGPASPDRLPLPANRHLRFVDEIIGATHRIERFTRGAGHLCAYPLDRPSC